MAKNIDFEPIVEKLSKEKLTAKFTPNGDRHNNPLYGYYHIKQSSMGPIIIEYSEFDDDNGLCVDMMHVRIQNLYGESFAFQDRDRKVFKKAKRLMKDLPITQSGFSKEEGSLLFFHFLDTPVEQVKVNNHYLNARVMYDTMHQMMRNIRNTKFFPVNGGYVIETVFDDNDIEVMHIKRTQEYNTYNNPYSVMQITIPSIGLNDRFDDYTNHTEMDVYNKAKTFIDIANGERYNPANLRKQMAFYRLDDAYINMMRKIQNHRVKAK